MTTSNIQPFVFTTSRTITSFSVFCQDVSLFTSATFRVDSYDENKNIVDRQYLTMSNEQYLAWNNDDSYVINFVATTIGYTIISSSSSTDVSVTQ
jgi:hypothetical protein